MRKTLYVALAGVLALFANGALAASAKKSEKPSYVLSEAESKIIITEGDITDRAYRVIGDISVSVDKAGVVDVPPLKTKVEVTLARKALEVGADAVVQVRYIERGFGIIRGRMEGIGRAVAFGPPGAAPPPAAQVAPQVSAPVAQAAPTSPTPAMDQQRPSQSAMKATLRTYIEALNGGDAPRVVALYADDATIEDPVGSRVQQGKAAVEAFIRGSVARGVKYELVAPIRGTNANAAAMAIKVYVGKTTISVIETFTFNPLGQITSMRAFWGSEDRETPP